MSIADDYVSLGLIRIVEQSAVCNIRWQLVNRISKAVGFRLGGSELTQIVAPGVIWLGAHSTAVM